MDPVLSRRVAKVMATEPIRALDLEEHLAFVDAVARASSFDDVPDWVREIVLAGERQVAEVKHEDEAGRLR